jgi:hypothetical protein
MMPELLATTVKGHAIAREINLYGFFINSHNLCDRIFVSVKRFFAR